MFNSPLTKLRSFLSKKADARALIISFFYTSAFLVWETIVFKFRFIEYFESIKLNYGLKNALFLYFLIFLTLVLLVSYIYTTLISPLVVRVVLIALFSFIIFLQYGYFNALGHFATSVDMEVALFMSNLEHKKGAILANLDWLALVPCLALILINFFYKKKDTFGKKFLFLFPPLLLIVLFYISSLILKPNIPIYPLTSFTNFTNELIQIPPVWFIDYKGVRQEIEKPSNTPETPDNNVVLVVDESISSVHLSVYGYQRDTTPYLRLLEKDNKIKKFNSAISGTFCSQGSGYMLLTGLGVDDLPDIDYQKTKTRPTIYQYAKAMNYKVHFFDGQMDHFWLSPYLDKQFVDDWKNKSYFLSSAKENFDIDLAIATRVKEIITSSKGNFIWVWKRGVHVPYYENYPKTQEIWKPTDKNYLSRENTQEEMINGYDNGVRYNIDNFFRIIAPAFESGSKNQLIYTSDHGEKNLLHRDSNATFRDKMNLRVRVPLILMGEFDEEINTNFKATHANIFPALLDLMKVPPKVRKNDYQRSLLDTERQTAVKRFYWDCDIRKNVKYFFD